MTTSNFADTDSTAVVICCMQHMQGLKQGCLDVCRRDEAAPAEPESDYDRQGAPGAMAVSLCMSPVWTTLHGHSWHCWTWLGSALGFQCVAQCWSMTYAHGLL